MTYRGRVKNGALQLEPGAVLPEGAGVRVQVTRSRAVASVKAGQSRPKTTAKKSAGAKPLQWLRKYAGTVKGLPADLSVNLDHYLYGAPKK